MTRIVLLVEGETERVFLPALREYLLSKLANRMPRIRVHKFDGRIPTADKLKRIVEIELSGKNPCDHVVALTDVYTGTTPPEFADAADAKQKMRQWVGTNSRFHPHAAQHDFEAWLLPYWSTIQRLAGHNMRGPTNAPELVNHGKSPAYWIKEIFEKGACRDSYVKTRDAGRILRESNLAEAIQSCPELKSLVNTIIRLSGGTALP